MLAGLLVTPKNKNTSSFLWLFFAVFILANSTNVLLAGDNKRIGSTTNNPYKKDIVSLHPIFKIFHDADRSSKLYFSINTRGLLYARSSESADFKANVSISYRVYPHGISDRTILDSATIRIEDVNKERKEKDLIGDVDVQLFNGSQYMIEIITRDLNRNQQVKNFVFVDKVSRGTSQNFLVESVETGLPLFRNYLYPDEKVYVRHREAGKTKRLFVRYYNRDYPLALPPFSIVEQKPFDYKCDSLFQQALDDSARALVNLPLIGFYHFQIDTGRQDGLTLFRYNNDFPDLARVEQLIYPLQYITSKQEFSEMVYSNNKKQALDNFWLNCAGTPDKAREAISKYYNRVEEANNYFSSYLEGWKTDRGMIHVIFGPPSIIYKNNFSESWIYGEENNSISLTFNFEKVYNPFTDNDYLLDRSAVYKTSWYRSVDIWREGKTYLEK